MVQHKYVMDEHSGLVLEGGGMRGVFTCGVLDSLMDRGVKFPYAVGVSAGACNGLSYVSGQRGRARYSNIDLMAKYNYISIKHLLLKGNIMDFDLLFDEFPNRIIPYDYMAMERSVTRFEMVTTDCITGRACYLEERSDPQRVISIVKASSSLPFVSPISYVDGRPMVDGGVADSIPIARAHDEGYGRAVVVLTRNRGYRKSEKPTAVPWPLYRRYPALREAIRRRNSMYNEQIALVERLESAGEIVVIRPERPIEVGRMERDTAKLLDLYNEGYAMAERVEFVLR